MLKGPHFNCQNWTQQRKKKVYLGGRQLASGCTLAEPELHRGFQNDLENTVFSPFPSKEQSLAKHVFPGKVLAMVGATDISPFKEILSRTKWGHVDPGETQLEGGRSENTSLFVFCFWAWHCLLAYDISLEDLNSKHRGWHLWWFSFQWSCVAERTQAPMTSRWNFSAKSSVNILPSNGNHVFINFEGG